MLAQIANIAINGFIFGIRCTFIQHGVQLRYIFPSPGAIRVQLSQTLIPKAPAAYVLLSLGERNEVRGD
jgi:hypothetical protein